MQAQMNELREIQDIVYTNSGAGSQKWWNDQATMTAHSNLDNNKPPSKPKTPPCSVEPTAEQTPQPETGCLSNSLGLQGDYVCPYCGKFRCGDTAWYE